MKRYKHTWLAALALTAAVVMPAVTASAAITYSDGDIVLAVRATAGVGNTQTYLVNIGNASQFTGVTGSINVSTLNSLGNIGLDLVNTFGTGVAGNSGGTEWYNRADLSWSLFGKDSLSPASIWASREETTVGTAAAAWNALNTTARNSTRNQIASVTGTFATADATANSSRAYVQTNGLTSASYNNQVSTANAFGTVSQWTTSGLEGDFANGTAGTALDLFAFTSSAAPTNLGSFTISNSGTLTFTGATAAVPEPSRALFGMLGMAAVMLRRRRPAVRA